MSEGAPAATGAVCALGLEFPAPVGLAAGFDRDGHSLRNILGWGFGFVELGTVTPQPQPDHNPGATALAANLIASGVLGQPIGARCAIGVNLGTQRDTPPGNTWCDYVAGMHAVWRCADYLVLNFTSDAALPLHAPAYRATLLALLAHAREERERLTAATGHHVPLLVKWPVRPGCVRHLEVLERVRALGYDGVVATFDCAPGAPIWEEWVPQACRQVAAAIGPGMAVVAVGGVDSAARALALRGAGADLVQIYRGFVAAGPGLVHGIARALARRAGAGCAVSSA